MNAVVAYLEHDSDAGSTIVFGATLTLREWRASFSPIGMAVDSNVLIFERVREELKSGKTVPRQSSKVLPRFRDHYRYHNVNYISRCPLVFGTGHVRGFASAGAEAGDNLSGSFVSRTFSLGVES